MPRAPLLVEKPKPDIPPAQPQKLDNNTKQALGRLQGPERKVADQALKELEEILKDTARREAIIAADEAISAGTAAGPDEIPGVGEVIVLGELGVAGWQSYKLAQNAKRAAELIKLLLILAAQVQIQEEEKRKKDCASTAPTS